MEAADLTVKNESYLYKSKRGGESSYNDATWDDIECLDGDDTVTKTFMMSNSAYEVQTVAIINANGKISENPVIRTSMSNNQLVVSINNNMHIFSTNCFTLKTSLKTGNFLNLNLKFLNAESVAITSEKVHTIECFAVCLEDFILTGESNGNLNLISIPFGQCVFSQNLFTPCERDACFRDIVISSVNSRGVYDAIVCGSDNKIYKVSNIDVQLLTIGEHHKKNDSVNTDVVMSPNFIALQENDQRKAYEFREFLEITVLNDGSKNDIAIKQCYTYLDDQMNFSVLAVGCGNTVLKLWTPTNRDNIQTLTKDVFGGVGLMKCQVSTGKRYIVVLDTENSLHILCSVSLMLLKTWSKIAIANVMFWEVASVDSRANCSSSESKLLILKSTDRADQMLQIYNFPSIENIFSTKLSGVIFFVPMPSYQDYTILLEGEEDDDDKDDKNFRCRGRQWIHSLKIKMINELLPSSRLSRLLKKKKFKDAEEFAKSFGLDVQVVYWSRLCGIADDLSNSKAATLLEKDLDDIISTIFVYINKLTTNWHMLVNYCQTIHMPSLEMLKKMLTFVHLKLKETETALEDNLMIKKMMYRLDTFEYIFGAEKFSEKWSDFYQCNIMIQFLKYMKEGELNTARSLWLRHEREIIDLMTADFIVNVLNAVPISIHTKKIHCKWLFESLLPTLLKSKPDFASNLSIWINAYSRNLELSDKEEWPSNALQFADKSVKVMNACVCSSELVQLTQDQQSISQLTNLIRNLKDLEVLKKAYSCHINYYDFCQEDKIVLGLQLLQSIHNIEHLSAFISDFLVSYLKRFGVDVDNVLLMYMTDVAASAGKANWFWEETCMEERMLTVIRKISSIEHFCQSVLALITAAPVPWTADIQGMADKALDLNPNIGSEITEQVRQAKVRTLLLDYDLLPFDLSKISEITQLIQYVVVQDRLTSLKDALEVANIYAQDIQISEVYLWMMHFLVQQDRMDDFFQLLKHIPQDLVSECYYRFVNFACNLLNINEDCNEHKVLSEEGRFTETALFVIQQLLTQLDGIEFEECCRIRGNLASIRALQIEFGIHMSVRQKELPSVCKDRLLKNFHEYLSTGKLHVKVHTRYSDARKETAVNIQINSFYRLAKLLNFGNEQTLGILVKAAIDNNKFNIANQLVRQCNVKVGLSIDMVLLFEEMKSILQNVKTGTQVGQITSFLLTIHDLIVDSLVQCSPDVLQRCVIITRWTATLKRIIAAKDLTTDQSDVFGSGCFKTVYEELTVSMDSVEATQLLISIIQLLVKSNRNETEESEILSAGTKLFKNLQTHGSHIMSCQVVSELVNYVCFNVENLGNFQTDQLLKQSYKNCLESRHNLLVTLLMNILSQKEVDQQFAVGIALNLPSDNVEKLLHRVIMRYNYNYEHALTVSSIGSVLASLWVLPDLLLVFARLYKHASWGKRLTEYHVVSNISIETEEESDWRCLLTDIVTNPNADIKLVQQFCMAFGCSLDDALLMYLENLLTSLPLQCFECSKKRSRRKVNTYQDPANNVVQVVNNLGSDLNYTVSFENTPLGKKVAEILRLIRNKLLLLNKMKSFLKKICPYDYEILSIVLNNIHRLVAVENPIETASIEKEIKILNFLYDYKRVGAPSESETLACDKFAEQVLSRRMPFQPLINDNPWKLITTELNLTNVSNWHSISSLLQLSYDQIVAVAVQNEVNRSICAEGTVQLLNSDFSRHVKFDKVLEIIEQMSDPTLAIPCANFVTERLPLGPLKVRAAKHAAHLAKKWVEKTTGHLRSIANTDVITLNLEATCKKLTILYQRISTEAILLLHNLRNPETLGHLRAPTKLIIYLYENYSVPNEQTTVTVNIHEVANEIANIHGVNLQDIQFNLLNKWLSPTEQSKERTAKSLLTYTTVKLQHVCRAEDEQNMLKAIYILRCLTLEESVLVLLNKIIQEEFHRSYAYRYRALKCLASIASNETIQQLSNNAIPNVLTMLRSFHFLSHLEDLRFPSDLTVFQNCDKEDLAHRIWNKHIKNPETVTLIANLCLEYNVRNINLWGEVLDQMINFEMSEELEHVLTDTAHFVELWELDATVQAWKFILMKPFRNVSETDAVESKKEKFLHVAALLFRSPVILNEFVPKLCAEFFKIHLPAVGIGCLLQLTNSSYQSSCLQMYSDTETIKLIRNNLLTLEENDLYFPQNSLVVEYLLDEAQNGVFDLVLDTVYFSNLTTRLIHQNRIVELLNYLEKLERWDDCLNLIDEYNSRYATTEQSAICLGLKEKKLTKMFFSIHNL